MKTVTMICPSGWRVLKYSSPDYFWAYSDEQFALIFWCFWFKIWTDVIYMRVHNL